MSPMIKLVNFYDTNALLELQEKLFETKDEINISSVTLEELENIKTSGIKSEDVKYKARNVVRLLNQHEGEYNVIVYDDEIDRLLTGKKIEKTNDAKICATAYYLEELTEKLNYFYTNDLLCKLIAEKIFELSCKTVHNDKTDMYKGYSEVEMTEEEMAEFFQHLYNNKYDLFINEYLIITNLDKDNVYKWNGEEHVKVNACNFKSIQFNTVKPKNAYQICAMDSIQENMITMLFGRSASGKTFLPIAYASQMMDKGKYNNITFIYSYDPLKGAKELGFEKGDHITKLLNYGAIGNILSTKFGTMDDVERKIEDGIINIVPTANIRGMSLSNSIVIVTEAQNLDPYTLKTIIQRCEDGCKLIIEGDLLEQTDTYHAVSGMKRFEDVFAGCKDVGIIKLKGNFRSHMGELADMM
jgi:predicted ribonuclease YlaK